MGITDNLTQGGQTFLHKVRMIKQVVRLGFLIGSGVYMTSVASLCVLTTPKSELLSTTHYLEAKLKSWMFGKNATQRYPYRANSPQVQSRDILSNRVIQKNVESLKTHLLHCSTASSYISSSSILLIFLYWICRGKRSKKKVQLSGQKVLPWQKVKQLLKKRRMASDISLGPLPLVKDSETQHILISGSTGSGKTNCFHHLLPQIRAKGQKAVIVDTTGDFVAKYYREGKDILLNPLDARSFPWNPWAECDEGYHFDELAQSAIPNTSSDPFWSNAARAIFSSTLKQLSLMKHFSVARVIDLINKASLEEFYAFLRPTEAASLVDPNSEKTAASIRATASTYLKWLEYLSETDNPFSIRHWVQDDDPNDDSWLFLSMTPEQREALRPLISMWTSIATKSLLGCTPSSDRRLWFILDELPSLNKLQDLTLCLAESRKYGGCVALGIQNLPQLEEIYNIHITKTITDLCSTKVLFRMANYDLAAKFSKALGQQELLEVQEGISYGANEIRDGVSLSKVNRERPTVPPGDLLNLENLEAYVKLAGDTPVAKVKFEYMDVPKIASNFQRSNASRPTYPGTRKKRIKNIKKATPLTH